MKTMIQTIILITHVVHINILVKTGNEYINILVKTGKCKIIFFITFSKYLLRFFHTSTKMPIYYILQVYLKINIYIVIIHMFI